MLAVATWTQNIWWYFARAGGLVAWALLAATVFWGLIYAGRLTRKAPTPGWNLDLHRFLGGLAVIFVIIHVTALMADRYVNFGVEQVLVPFASHWRPGAVAWGITAMYLVVAVEVSSLAMRWLPRSLWRKIHMLSFVLFAVSTVHGIQSGTDAAKPWVRGIGIILLATATATLVLRIVGGRRKAAARAGRRPVLGAPVAVVAPSRPALVTHSPVSGVVEPEDSAAVGPIASWTPVRKPAGFAPAAPRPAAANACEDRPRHALDVPVNPTTRPVPAASRPLDRRRPSEPPDREHLSPVRPYAMATPRREVTARPG